MKWKLWMLFPAVSCLSLPALAAPAGLDTGDTAWVLSSGMWVLFMSIPGLALFYGGMVRKKNVLSIKLQCFAICCLVSLLWAVAGYTLAFSTGNGFIGGLSDLLLNKVTTTSLTGTIPTSAFVFFQMTFAVISAAIITGAVAERMKFSALLVFIALWLLLVYAPICHWVWGSDGWLMNKGILDFAGGTVVHINAGVSGLVAAMVVGKRRQEGCDQSANHNLTLTLVGGAMLWVGWFGFNAGSALGAGQGAGMAMLTTQLAAASGALAWMFAEWSITRKPSVLGTVSGAIAGLVAITPAAGFVTTGAAIGIGLLAGVICYWATAVLKTKLGYDDSLDCFGIHGIGGIVGALLTGVFASSAIGGTAGVIEGNWAQLGLQALGVVVTVVYATVASYILLKIIGLAVNLRVDDETERRGLDIAEHGERVE
ncbi:ammonium transporter [Dongshaea marina]|uniref:ammonium transporter n=1 Tax=Dongshaea marina TaxID=2047966 RepID=UPI000D3EA990|nr:ammonium transporter [Dongshaea marina]